MASDARARFRALPQRWLHSWLAWPLGHASTSRLAPISPKPHSRTDPSRRPPGRLAERRLALGALASALFWASSSAVALAGSPPPSVRLLATFPPKVTLDAEEVATSGTSGIFVAAVGGDFELRVSRPDYEKPLRLTQVDAGTGAVVRALPSRLAAGWEGLRRFARVTVRSSRGRVVSSSYIRFCPNGRRQRVSDLGPLLARYPEGCRSFPFARGMVWGIDAGWAASLTSEPGELDEMLGNRSLRELAAAGRSKVARTGQYTVTARIAPLYRKLFAIPEAAGQASVKLTVRTKRPPRRRRARGHRPAASARARAAQVPTVAAPEPGSLPDLVALPSYDIQLVNRRGRNVLRFASTTWNAGPGELVIEGFRRPRRATMDAYQYFLDQSGTAVGRASVGTMRYHAAGSHDHWHLLQFAGYSLLDASRRRILRGRKQSFCLAPTHAVDLTLQRAKWAGGPADLATECGSPVSIWVREALAVGWGDTYGASLQGQAFDVTKLPNGRYYLRTQANPLASLREAATSNNVALRTIRLKGRGTRRRVTVAPWKGIRR